MQTRRYFLIIPLLSVVWWTLFDWGRNAWVAAPLGLISSFIMFYNIPWLVRALHLKPVYYEDLEDDLYDETGDEVDEKTRYRFQNYFTLAITILLSITFCIVLDYIFYNFNRSNMPWQECVAMIGGAMSLYGKIQDKIGKMLLLCIMKSKKKHQQKRSSLELIEVNESIEPTKTNHPVIKETPHLSDDLNCIQAEDDTVSVHFSEYNYESDVTDEMNMS